MSRLPFFTALTTSTIGVPWMTLRSYQIFALLDIGAVLSSEDFYITWNVLSLLLLSNNFILLQVYFP